MRLHNLSFDYPTRTEAKLILTPPIYNSSQSGNQGKLNHILRNIPQTDWALNGATMNPSTADIQVPDNSPRRITLQFALRKGYSNLRGSCKRCV